MKNFGVFLFAVALGASLVPLISFATASFYVDSSTGYVGIGNTTPASPLDVSGALYSRLVTDSDSSSVTINWNSGNVHTISLDTAATTFTFTNGQAGGVYSLILNQDATGGRTVSWPASVVWVGGNPPTLTAAASSTDMVSFVYNGSNYLGSYRLNYEAPGIAFDNAHNYGNIGSGTSWTESYTASGNNICLVVQMNDNAQNEITSMTYGGTSLSKVNSSVTKPSTGNDEVWIGDNMPSGTNNLVINSNTSDSPFLAVASYNGCQTTGQPDSSYSSVSGSQTTSFSQTTSPSSAAGDWAVWAVQTQATPTMGSNTTSRVTNSNGDLIADSNGSIGASGSTWTFNATIGSASWWEGTAITLFPAN